MQRTRLLRHWCQKTQWVDLPHINKRLPGIQGLFWNKNFQKATGVAADTSFLSLLTSFTMKLEIGRLRALQMTSQFSNCGKDFENVAGARVSRTARRL